MASEISSIALRAALTGDIESAWGSSLIANGAPRLSKSGSDLPYAVLRLGSFSAEPQGLRKEAQVYTFEITGRWAIEEETVIEDEKETRMNELRAVLLADRTYAVASDIQIPSVSFNEDADTQEPYYEVLVTVQLTVIEDRSTN